VAIRMARGWGQNARVRDDARWLDLLTSEGSLVLEVGQVVARDAHYARFTFRPGRRTALATIRNASGTYTLAAEGNTLADRCSGGTWATLWLTRLS